MNAVDFHTVYLLHQRPYTDSKILVDILSRTHGRVSAVFRANKKTRASGGVSYFRPMEAKWGGRGKLKTLHALELSAHAKALVLDGKKLFCGFYMNEVIVRSLPESDVSATEEVGLIFDLYEQTLIKLAKTATLHDAEPLLRRFEFFLLTALGFGVDFSQDAMGCPIKPEENYVLNVEEGFVGSSQHHVLGNISGNTSEIFSGEVILSIGRGDLSLPETLQCAKKISRKLLPLIIGDKPLKSRELFV